MTRQVAVGIDGVKSHCQTVVILELRSSAAIGSDNKASLSLRLICFREDGGQRTLDDSYRSAGSLTGAVKHKSSRRCVLFRDM